MKVILKQDVFSTVERGIFVTPNGDVEAVLRRIDVVPWWSYGIARHFLVKRFIDCLTHADLTCHCIILP